MSSLPRVILFVLPSASVVSSTVRALCLQPHFPVQTSIYYVQNATTYRFKIGSLINAARLIVYLAKNTSKYSDVYVVKSLSILSAFVVKLFFFHSSVLDINDPYHHSRILGPVRATILFLLYPKKVFESIEYLQFCQSTPPFSALVSNAKIIEDTHQHSCIVDFDKKKPIVAWVGSSHTCTVLNDYILHLQYLNSIGLRISLLGLKPAVRHILDSHRISYDYKSQYTFEDLEHLLSTAQFAFVPMPANDELFTLRGNLKAKLCMSFGCCVLASKLPMHQRLIMHGYDGILFRTMDDMSTCLSRLTPHTLSLIMRNAYHKVHTNYSTSASAKRLYRYLTS